MICVEIRISIDTLIESLATCWTYSDVVRVYVYGERLKIFSTWIRKRNYSTPPFGKWYSFAITIKQQLPRQKL